MEASEQTSQVDVLIIGAGPAGLMAANWMSRLGIKTRIIDKKASKINAGQADALHARTLEIWESFGIVDKVLRECNPLFGNESPKSLPILPRNIWLTRAEVCYWGPGANSQIKRLNRFPIAPAGLSRYGQVLIHQGQVEDNLLETIYEHSDIRVERATLPEQLEITENTDSYPVKVTLLHLRKEDATQTRSEVPANGMYRSNLSKDDTEYLITKGRQYGRREVVNAKYLIACEGAHSWTRKQLGFKMEGEHSDYIWGVLDIIPITDFPDIRNTCTIQNDSGSILVVPREKKLVRLYIQLDNIPAHSTSQRFDYSSKTPEELLERARKIMCPYKLDYVHCSWWTVYRVGQRVSSHYQKDDRIFLAGDAVHTHSPKAGQGQNVSMQDAYNLGWKIGMVVRGQLGPSILSTYTLERKTIAEHLVEFDRKLSHQYSDKSNAKAQTEDLSNRGMKATYSTAAEFMAGVNVDYPESALTLKGNSANDYLATGLSVGMRVPSARVISQSDARPWDMQTLLPSTGHFRIIIFGGDISESDLLERTNTVGEHLAAELFPQYTNQSSKRACPIEVILVHTAARESINLLEDLVDVFHPLDEEFGYDYDRVFVDGKSYDGQDGKAYDKYGITEEGCVVIVRPDQYISWVGSLEDLDEIDAFFEGILIRHS
ncbi:hypothetical protein PWT90_06035 [Aphanocladium album]|nr:hypothetical protein PWT90_06035 [Aphanocladium album]